MIFWARVFAVLIGAVTLLYQIGETIADNKLNNFLVADAALCAALVAAALWRNQETAKIALIAAFAYAAGIFTVVSTGGMISGNYTLASALTTIGLIICVTFVALISRQRDDA